MQLLYPNSLISTDTFELFNIESNSEINLLVGNIEISTRSQFKHKLCEKLLAAFVNHILQKVKNAPNL